jgi:hypothetical protein
MVTVIIHGRPTQAVYLDCDPLPGKSEGPTVLRVRWRKGDARLLDGSLAPIAFELGGTFYEGWFRQVSRTEDAPDEIACTLISEGPIKETVESSWSRSLKAAIELGRRLWERDRKSQATRRTP